jgi:hypothetical protein
LGRTGKHNFLALGAFLALDIVWRSSVPLNQHRSELITITQLPGQIARYRSSRQRMAVMAGDNIVVGKPSVRKRSQAIIAHPTMPTGPADQPKVDRTGGRRPQLCGAMSQQRDDSGAQSMPQKFVHLVGCRDPKMRPPLKR